MQDVRTISFLVRRTGDKLKTSATRFYVIYQTAVLFLSVHFHIFYLKPVFKEKLQRMSLGQLTTRPVPVAARSSAARLLRLWVRIPPGAWMFVCCECCLLSGRRLCDGLITRPEESYLLWRVVVFDQETSKTRRLKPATGL